MKIEEVVPADFPRPGSGAVPGAAQKFLAQRVGDKFVVGVTNEELRLRYEGCCELLSDLVAYCARKRQENPSLPDPELYQRVERGLLASTDLGTSPAENAWILSALCAHQGWTFDMSP